MGKKYHFVYPQPNAHLHCHECGKEFSGEEKRTVKLLKLHMKAVHNKDDFVMLRNNPTYDNKYVIGMNGKKRKQ